MLNEILLNSGCFTMATQKLYYKKVKIYMFYYSCSPLSICIYGLWMNCYVILFDAIVSCIEISLDKQVIELKDTTSELCASLFSAVTSCIEILKVDVVIILILMSVLVRQYMQLLPLLLLHSLQNVMSMKRISLNKYFHGKRNHGCSLSTWISY